MVLFEYEWRDTFLHRLHPLTKILLFLSFVVIGWIWWDLRFVVPLGAVVIALVYASKVPKWWIYVSATAMLMLGVWTASQTIFIVSPAYFRNLPPDLANKVVLLLVPKELSPWGEEVAFKFGNLLYLTSWAIKLVETVVVSLVFIWTTSPSDVSKMLMRWKVPMSICFIFMTVIRFFVILQRDILTIADAQKLRGWRVRSKNPIKVLKQMIPLLVPVTRRIPRIVDEIDMSTSVRAFGSGRAVPLWELKSSLADYMISAICILVAGIATYAYLFYNIGAL